MAPQGQLLRGTPPYPWWQWVLVGLAWGGMRFLIFAARARRGEDPPSA